MAATPLTVGMFVLALVVVSVVGGWLMLRVDSSPAHRRVASGGRKAERFRSEVRAQAPDRGWRVQTSEDRPFPAGAVPRRATPVACRLAVTGDRPRPFRAESWQMEHRTAGLSWAPPSSSTGSPCSSTGSSHKTLPDFAVTGDGSWAAMLATLPEALVGDGRSVGGLTVHGGGEGRAERLVPLAAELRAEELWVVVAGREVTLVREGELDVAGLQRRLDLGGRVAAALSAP